MPRAVPPDPARLRVAVDATPLLGARTGVGEFCAGALGALGARPDVAVTAYAVTWRRRHRLPALLPAGVAVSERAMPARPLQAAWRRTHLPPVEWLVGPADVVHGTNFVVPPTRRAGRVVTVHDLTVVRFPELCDASTSAFPALVRRAIDDGAWVHTPSRFVAEEVVALLGADPSRVRAVHHGIPPRPTGPAGPAAASPSLPGGARRYVLAVGTVEPRKDFPGLVHAFDRLAGDRPDVALVIAGGRGWGAGALDAALHDAAFASRVACTGYVDEARLTSLLAGAAVLAYPSRYEGFGFPPLEAMAAGVPVVATAAGAVPEVAGDGAELVAPGDPDALAGALARVLDDHDARQALVARGRARAAAFTWEACAEGLCALYRQAAQ